jgi:hypothetical protein
MTTFESPDLTRFGIFTTAEALRAGHTKGAIRHRLSTGRWVALRRGIYIEARKVEVFGSSRLGIAAALGAISPGAVASHWSAARLLGVQTLVAIQTTWVTRPPTSRNGRHILPCVVERAAALPPHHVTLIDGLPSTSAARTVVDLARMSTLEGGVVSADSALRMGLTTSEELLAVGTECRSWPGGVRALRAVAFANALAESPLESVSRVAFARMGLPTPELQVEIRDAAGIVGRLDFYWNAQRTAGEADGRSKYDDAQVLWDEKRREDRLRETGLEVVRWSSNDINDRPNSVHERVLAAFRRGGTR